MAASRKGRMSEGELIALLDGQIQDAVAFDRSDLASKRELALKYFEGQLDIPAQPNRSQYVSRDLADTHGLILPGLGRVFLNTDRICEYEAEKEGDEEFAKQATDYVSWLVKKECDGYRHLRNAFSDGLLHGNGIIKHWWDPSQEITTEEFTGLDDDAYTLLVADPEVELVEHSEYPDPSAEVPNDGAGVGGSLQQNGGGSGPFPAGDAGVGGPVLGGVQPSPAAQPAPLGAPAAPVPPPGGTPSTQPPDMGMGLPDPNMGMGGNFPPPPMLHDVKIKRICSYGRLRLASVPPEQFVMDRNATVLNEEEVRFCAHRLNRTRSSLVKEGYDKAQVDALPVYSGADTSAEDARDDDRWSGNDNAPDRSTELVEIYECFVQIDYDGDGVAEWRKVVVGGAVGARQILEHEEWGDDLPFSDIVPEPVPHRWVGRSLYDETADIQKMKSVALRAVFDNTYWVGNPQREVVINNVEADSFAELDNPTFGGRVNVKAPGTITPLPVPFVVDKLMPVVEMMDGIVEKRTGVSKASMALDMDVLQGQTATAVNANQAAAFTKIEEYARNIAECGGMQRIFKCILKLLVKHQDKPRTIKLRGDWVTMDPKAWNANMHVTINTGLGSGSRDRDLQMLQGIAQKQELVLGQMGPANPVLSLDKLFETYRLMVEAAGVRSPERFFPEISPQDVQQMAQAQSQRPDPKMLELQGKMQLEQAKMQAQAQLEQAKLQQQAQMDQIASQAKLQAEQQKLQLDAQREAMESERSTQREAAQMQADIAVRQREMDLNAQMEERKFAHQVEMERVKFEFEKQLKLLDLDMRREDMAQKAQERQQMAQSKAAEQGMNTDV